ncbi:MAG TPA: trigger factor [Gemmatimonadales bacterium]
MSQITVEKTAEDAASKSLKVTVPVERVRAAEAKAITYYAQRARLPGFRKGKAPEAVVRKRFTDAIRQSVLEEVLRESWETARTSESLEPISEPSVRNLRFEEGSPIEFEILVEVRPEISLERTEGFRLTRTVPQVTDAAVEEQLQAMRDQKAAWLPVEGERPAPGHLVQVEVTPIEDGKESATQTYPLVLGEGRTVPDLEERIMTLAPGEEVEADIRFPDDHPDTARRGQTRRVRVKLLEVKRKELPALDDAFAREAGEFETLDDLRAAVRQDLEREATREADARLRDDLIRQLAEANAVPAPESLVHRVMHGYANAYGIPDEQIHTFEGQFHSIAEAHVRRDLILGAVVRANGLEATEGDIDARVAEMAGARAVDAGQLYAQLQKANRLPELERAITEEKAFAWLLSKSTVDEATS